MISEKQQADNFIRSLIQINEKLETHYIGPNLEIIPKRKGGFHRLIRFFCLPLTLLGCGPYKKPATIQDIAFQIFAQAKACIHELEPMSIGPHMGKIFEHLKKNSPKSARLLRFTWERIGDLFAMKRANILNKTRKENLDI